MQVTLNAEASRIAVFRRGAFIGAIPFMPLGGHVYPSSEVGMSVSKLT